MDFTWIGALVGSLGGIELLKWFFNRKRQGRADEFKLLREQLVFMQEQDKEKEERFVSQTTRLRETQDEFFTAKTEWHKRTIEYERRIAELELELASVRCNDKRCPWREPPTAHTEPKPKRMTKQQYHESKQQKKNDDNKTEQQG